MPEFKIGDRVRFAYEGVEGTGTITGPGGPWDWAIETDDPDIELGMACADSCELTLFEEVVVASV